MRQIIENVFFDVFDTVLTRRVVVPSDVFRYLYRADARLQALFKSLDEDAFVAARMRAEQIALCSAPECTLSEIWREMENLLGFECDLEGAELEAERTHSISIASALAEIHQYRANGSNIGFISDSYLPEVFIRDLLTKCGALLPADKLFVSSATRKTKRAGQMYAHVVQTLNIMPQNCLMIGDNKHSDIKVPRKLGWRTRHFTPSRLNTFERQLLADCATSRLGASVLSGNIRAMRVSGTTESNARKLVECILGPASMLWALWTLKECTARGIEHVHFLARDAHLAYICAQHCQPLIQDSPRIHYLKVSRKALIAASVAENICPQSLRSLVSFDIKSTTVSSVLRQLDLSDTNVLLPSEFISSSQRLSYSDLSTLLNALCEEPTRTILAEKYRLRAVEAKRYLEISGLLEAKKTAIVDLGWHLTIQCALRKLIPCDHVIGIYVYLSADRRLPREAGEAVAMFQCSFADASHLNTTAEIARHPTAVEHLFGQAEHGTVLGYDLTSEGATPRCQISRPASQRFAKEICIEMERFAIANSPIYNQLFKNSIDCANHFRVLTDAFLRTPPLDLVLPIANAVYISSDPENVGDFAIAKPLSLADGVRFLIPALFGISRPIIDWPGACLVLSNPVTRLTASVIGAMRNFVKNWLNL